MDNLERQRAAESAGHPEWADMPETAGDAWRADVTRFFTGKECRHGHIAPRGRAGGRCVVCDAASKSKWQKGIGREKYNAYMRQYMRSYEQP